MSSFKVKVKFELAVTGYNLFDYNEARRKATEADYD